MGFGLGFCYVVGYSSLVRVLSCGSYDGSFGGLGVGLGAWGVVHGYKMEVVVANFLRVVSIFKVRRRCRNLRIA